VSRGGCDIAHFEPEHLEGSVEVLAALWPGDREARTRLFRWKYLENPHADRALGIVALDRNRVVGFRGYFADRFTCDGDGSIGVLHPGDTCVLPSHRNRGLSVEMGRLAMQYDGDRYRLFMNFSSSRNSLPGYVALGFRPLTPRVLLQRHGRNPLRWLTGALSKRMAGADARRPHRRPRLGQRGNVLASGEARPAEMAAVIASGRDKGPALRLVQDESFFAWRYRNPDRQYVFYYLLEAGVARAFVVLAVSRNALAARIVDYGAADGRALQALVSHVCRSRDFAVLTIFRYGVDPRLQPILAEQGFVAVHTRQTLVRKGSVEALAFPVLIRPIAKSYDDEAFMIGSLDMRRIEAWRLKPICSDGE
jgi:hypothetical protein